MRVLLVLLAALAATPSRAAPGVCRYKESCGYHCCRGTPGASCICSLCCNTKEADLGPDDRAAVVTNGRLTAKVYRHRVEFFAGKSAKPRLVRSYDEGIYPVDESSGREGLFALCTSDEWGVVRSSGAQRGFCGVLRLDGRVAASLKEGEGPGLSREPVGVAANGMEAVFAVTKARKDGDREVVGYRLWQSGRPEELLPADGPRTRKILEKYHGPLVLTDPDQTE